MNDLIYKNILLSSKELKILAAYSGIETLRIISGHQQKELEPQEINEIVFQLYQRGILRWSGNHKYELQSEIRLLFYDMKYAEKELEVRGKTLKSPLHCFWDKEVVVTELSQNDADRIKLHRVKQNEFFEELWERELIPLGTSREQSQSLQEKMQENFQKKFSDLGLCRAEDIENAMKILEEIEEVRTYILVYDRKEKRIITTILLLDNQTIGYVLHENSLIQIEEMDKENIRKAIDYTKPGGWGK